MRIKRLKSLKGLSLIEVLVTVSIFTGVALIALPFGVSQLGRQRTQAGAEDIASSLALAQQFAKTGLEDSAYGIAFTQGEDSYTVFRGTSLADASWSEVSLINGGAEVSEIEFAGENEVVFPPGELAPVNEGQIIIGEDEDSYLLSINSEGLINYERL
ncbi:MAG: pilus assembly FimT family protein [Candidatus Dojkabacteria bacterium]